MKFHDVHGVNASLDESKRIAKRINSFCDAFVFSSNPLRLNTPIIIRLSSRLTSEWHGTCFIGLTSRNPANFMETVYSKHIINLLTTNVDDVWIKQISSDWSNVSLILSLNSDGFFEITTEYDPSLNYVFLENLPINLPLWLILDLYGQTEQVQFPRYSSPNSREIVSLGSDIYSTYKCGENGIIPYNSARIILIGPKSSGKKSSDPSICHLITNNHGEWNLIPNSGPSKLKITHADKSDIYHEIAKNIVQEIVTNKDQFDANESHSPKDLIKNVLRFPRKLLRPYSKEVKQLSENLVSFFFWQWQLVIITLF
ncbi:Neuralized-like protein [Euroglyphus maynei]|uniref:Neuralized-like protein n=1 Tax=Euroglyphus maynei TaxID=6958 RepID=A0A1Y3B6J9_EURMA|nr:Neuralized-like protein [Euroglyphus maynei]